MIELSILVIHTITRDDSTGSLKTRKQQHNTIPTNLKLGQNVKVSRI